MKLVTICKQVAMNFVESVLKVVLSVLTMVLAVTSVWNVRKVISLAQRRISVLNVMETVKNVRKIPKC